MTKAHEYKVIAFLACIVIHVECLLPSMLPQRPSIESIISRRRTSCVLSMGFRSMLRKLSKEADNDDELPPRKRIQPIISPRLEDQLEREHQQHDEILQQKPSPAPLRMGETTPGSGVVDAARITEDESIQDKINRVKSGQMTEEEKRAFLATALSAGMTPESRKPLIQPKRMENSSASPFPTDSILRNFVSGKVKQRKKDISLSSISLDLNTDAKKKEYIDMIMDPDRFSRRLKNKSNSSSYNIPSKPTAPATATIPSSPPRAPQQTNNNSIGGMEDLGARLGMHAMEEEVRRREAEKQRAREKLEHEERERRAAIQQQEVEQRAAEVARRQQMALKQIEEQARRQEVEEEQMKKEEAMAAEQERLSALLKQQEAYWTERLAKEKEAKAKREQAALLDAKKQKEQVLDYSATNNVQQQQSQSTTAYNTRRLEQNTEARQSMQREEFNPNEMNLLEEAQHYRNAGWEHNQQAIQWGATHTPGLPPPLAPPVVQSESDFLEEQAKKKADIDRAREEQFLRLKEMNSPLPTPVVRVPSPAPSQHPSSLFRQPQPVVTKYRPTKTTIQDIQEASRNAEMHKRQDAQRSQSLPPLTRPYAGSSEIMRQPSIPSISPPPYPVQPPRPLTSDEWIGQTRPNLFGGTNKRGRSPTPTPQPALATAPSTTVRPERQGPIRMQLPLGDDVEDGGIDAKASNGMSIADAMRGSNQQSEGGDQSKRSKQWGVDMSRFLD
ncbi:hypothetical protein MPSEU_000379000 [Mayamaea pseudoterrestris]|nr:hypothetical protein MPSEU_000379000 [Mayamaea pseudoterrestris]